MARAEWAAAAAAAGQGVVKEVVLWADVALDQEAL
jgi:hypothetical protein